MFDITYIQCPLKDICWRLSYSRYLKDVGYANDAVPIRFELFQAGYCNLTQMDRGGKGGIFAERFPSVQEGIVVNLCPCIRDKNNYIECCEYKKYNRKKEAIAKRKKVFNPYSKRREYIPVEIRHQIAAKYKYKCKYCGRSTRHIKCHVDHIIPISRGGTNDIDNLCLACQECNQRKYNKIYAKDLKDKLDGI